MSNHIKVIYFKNAAFSFTNFCIFNLLDAVQKLKIKWVTRTLNIIFRKIIQRMYNVLSNIQLLRFKQEEMKFVETIMERESMHWTLFILFKVIIK